MAQPYSLEDTIRRHDEAFYNWLGGLLVDYGNIAGTTRNAVPILRVFASPDRAWATTVELLVKQGWISGANAAEMRSNAANNFEVLPLPLATIVRGSIQTYPEGDGVPKRFRKQGFLGATGAWESHAWPGSYRTEYRVNFWSKKRYTEVFMREWLMSQLGKIGAGSYEVFIPVAHANPWGTLSQALRYESDSDLSNLEGEEQRFIRFEMSFTLNTLLFRTPASNESPVETIIPSAGFATMVDPQTQSVTDATTFDLAPSVESSNLYKQYYEAENADNWPTAGNGEIEIKEFAPTASPEPTSLQIKVTASSDQVDVASRPLTLDAGGHALLSIAFQYRSTGAIKLDLQQHDGTNMASPTWTRQCAFDLPARSGWTRFHQFSLVTDSIFDLAVIGTSVAATASFNGVSVRHVYGGTKLNPTLTTGSPNNVYTWVGLAKQPHLVVLELSHNPATPASGPVQVQNDNVSPTYSRTETISDSQRLVAVYLIEPKTAALRLQVASSLSVVACYAQRYDGGYRGHDL